MCFKQLRPVLPFAAGLIAVIGGYDAQSSCLQYNMRTFTYKEMPVTLLVFFVYLYLFREIKDGLFVLNVCGEIQGCNSCV